MRRRLLMILLLLPFAGAFAQRSFAFTSTGYLISSIGEETVYELIKAEITFTYKDSILSARKANGEEWTSSKKIKRILDYKQREAGELKKYFLEYKDDSGLIVYATYIKGSKNDSELEQLIIPSIAESATYTILYANFYSR